MAPRPVRFPPGSIPPAGLYRSTGSGRTRFFDGGTPLPGSVNSSSWQQVSDHYRVVETAPDPLARHVAVTDAHHAVRFAAGTVVSPGEYRNAASGAVRYFDGATPLPGGVNGSSWQQVSDHYHAHNERSEHDRRPLIEFPAPPRVREPAAATAVLEAPAVVAPSAPSVPSAPANAGELAVELIRRVNDGEDAVAELFAHDAHLFFPVGSLLVCHRGHAQLRRFLEWLRANLEDHTLSIERVSGEEDAVTVDFDTRGRVMSGEDFDRPGALMVEARGGLIRMVHIALGARRAA
ncbi:MAG TPA: nuclear transport factor 2 family protein [Candidatus Dormibacteraeota bacterium]